MRNPYQRKAATKSQKTAFDPQQLYKQYIEAIVANACILHSIRMGGPYVPRRPDNAHLPVGKVKVWLDC